MRDFFSPVLILDLWSQMTISGAMIAEGRVIATGEFRRGRNQTYLLAFAATSSTKSIEGDLTLCCRILAETCYRYDGPGQPRGGQPVFPATPACRSRAPPGHGHCVGIARCECATAVDQIRPLLQASASAHVMFSRCCRKLLLTLRRGEPGEKYFFLLYPCRWVISARRHRPAAERNLCAGPRSLQW